MFIVYRIAVEKSRQSRHSATAAGLLGCFAVVFELLLAQCAQSFERLPCVEDADLLRNILYSGVWLKYNCKTAKQARSRG